MNQIQDKVKDVVVVCANQQLEDFVADFAQTLSEYYFTDITSDLMAKWIDRVMVMPTGSGNAYALAGYRGVGKSHFLAVFGAILSQPELRTRIKDSHVFASAERLIRRHYPVIHVRRGTKETLADELKSAIASCFEVDAGAIGNTPAEIIKFTADKGGAGPSVLIIDTDIERESRVSRDDGSYLAELAEASNGTNVFLAVALDDDVATADGRNSGISRCFTIDYLDHEHLYKIIDSHIFTKFGHKRAVITNIFERFRSVLPSFRWSEQRFASVYPLHPVILEVAPFVRLFVQDFALLSFASEAGAKILGRPADSLVALDELFDHVEQQLRKSADLKDAFASYDDLMGTLINKIPVMNRLRAKLVLKGLMLLSLDSEGATVNDITAAMLIFDDREPQSAIDFVEDLLEKIAAASNGRVWKMERDARAAKYGFSLSGKENFNTALAEAVQTVPDSVVNDLLRRLMHDRFGDCEFNANENGVDVSLAELEWRGGVRHGRLIWNVGNRGAMPSIEKVDPAGWEVLIDFVPISLDQNDRPLIQWKPDDLKPEEFDTFRKYHVLMSREDLQQTFRDEFRTTIQTFTIAIEKIWDRKFLQYGKLLVGGTEYPITAEAAAGHSIAEVFSTMLSPYFESQFPEHPVFGARLELARVDELATGLFAARESISPDVQKLAEALAVPIGLADVVNGAIEVRPVETLLSLHSVTVLMEMLSRTDGVVTVDELKSKLGASPFGLTFEAQCLLLTALVARGVIEFVTTSGDRIGSRSLDLKLVWGDVAGVSTPTESQTSADRLVKWAALLSGDKEVTSLGSEAARKKVKTALSNWLGEWQKENVLERLDRIPDHSMTTELWHLGSRARKSFGAAADAINSVSAGTMDVEAALRMIQEAFSASNDEFNALKTELGTLRTVLDALPVRTRIRSEIAEYEITDDPAIEDLRHQILSQVDDRRSLSTPQFVAKIEERWGKFKSLFEQFVSERHENTSRSHSIRDRVGEMVSSREWWVFENLAGLEPFSGHYRQTGRKLLRELRSCSCTAPVSNDREGPPFCPVCGFTMERKRRRERLPDDLWKIVHEGLESYDRLVRSHKNEIAAALTSDTEIVRDKDAKESAAGLAEKLKNGVQILDCSENELRVLRIVLERHIPRLSRTYSEVDEHFSPVITAEEIIEDVVVVNS